MKSQTYRYTETLKTKHWKGVVKFRQPCVCECMGGGVGGDEHFIQGEQQYSKSLHSTEVPVEKSYRISEYLLSSNL